MVLNPNGSKSRRVGPPINTKKGSFSIARAKILTSKLLALPFLAINSPSILARADLNDDSIVEIYWGVPWCAPPPIELALFTTSRLCNHLAYDQMIKEQSFFPSGDQAGVVP